MQYKSLNQAKKSELQIAWKQCASLTHRAAGNFYYAFIFLPEKPRHGIQALYAFLRAGDDITDSEEDSNKAEKLDKAFHILEKCFEGLYYNNLTLALSWAIREFDLQKQHFEDMFLGLKSDLNMPDYNTFEDLKLYCYRVASTVGLLCLRIFGVDNENSRKYAENLGIAMQLTNILRDIREDWESNRIYLPNEDLKKFQLNEDNLLDDQNSSKLHQLVLFESERAEKFYNIAESFFPEQDRKKLIAASIMGSIYKSLLQKIKRSEMHDKRIVLSKREKLALGYKAHSRTK